MNFRKPLQYIVGLVSREHILSLADQTVVSGTSFLTTVLIARWFEPTGNLRRRNIVCSVSRWLSRFSHLATLCGPEILPGGDAR